MVTDARSMRSRWLMTLSLLAVWAGSTVATAAETHTDRGALTSSHADFCINVERRLVDTALPITNRIHTSKDAFTASKASVDPPTTEQFLERDAKGRPLEISCKTKSADHLRAVHGAQAARDPALPPRSCVDIHRVMVNEIWSTLDERQRAAAVFPPTRIMLVADVMRYTGSGWIGSPAETYVAADGRLRLRAAALYAEWEDWRWKIMPKSFRGNHYCHLVAPERIRALMLGEERLKP